MVNNMSDIRVNKHVSLQLEAGSQSHYLIRTCLSYMLQDKYMEAWIVWFSTELPKEGLQVMFPLPRVWGQL
jgi:hypothetical protein